MLNILKYIFSDVWIFIGIIMLLYVVGEIINNMIVTIGKVIVILKGGENNDKTEKDN